MVRGGFRWAATATQNRCVSVGSGSGAGVRDWVKTGSSSVLRTSAYNYDGAIGDRRCVGGNQHGTGDQQCKCQDAQTKGNLGTKRVKRHPLFASINDTLYKADEEEQNGADCSQNISSNELSLRVYIIHMYPTYRSTNRSFAPP